MDCLKEYESKIEAALDKADHAAAETPERYSAEDVFSRVREKLNNNSQLIP